MKEAKARILAQRRWTPAERQQNRQRAQARQAAKSSNAANEDATMTDEIEAALAAAEAEDEKDQTAAEVAEQKEPAK